jgi:signal transduction histidine kinase
MSTPETAIDLDDLMSGITSIKKRSEGLMKFAKTYRTLNTITHVNRSKVNAQELFKSIEDLMQPTLLQKGVTLTFMFNDTVLFLEIDTYLIEQVLINLILNAIDATQGVPNPEIIISVIKNTKGNVQIIVRDNGSGIPDEILDSIFIPFFSTKKTGSGIGLSLCKQIMTLHQGKIQLRNLENSGTEARLIF